MVNLTFPDGSVKEFKDGVTGLEVAKSISEGLARNALAIKLNSQLVDLSSPIKKDCAIKIITFKDKEGVEVFRHSTSHVLAAAVVKLWPDALPTIGPAVDEGFYYDFGKKEPFKPEDLEKIEAEMKAIAKSNLPFERIELTKSKAKQLFKNNPYKLELVEEYGKDLSAYKLGDFTDLCRGPHIPLSGKIEAFKLTKISSCYWRGDSANQSLQRIYGISFPENKELKNYLVLIEEAEKRDHRKIGKEMDLFMMHELSPGMPFFLPNGMVMLIELINFVREFSYGEGYKEVRTPQVFNSELWKVSGHWEHYKDDMFCMHHAEDNIDLAIKPMNCPAHMLIFKRDVHSYKELPLRIAETTTLYRNEKSGTLAGLTRVRSLSQDDTHIFLAEGQILGEIKNLLDKIKVIYSVFDLKIDAIHLSTRPEKFLGKKETWDFAEANLKNALDESGLKYQINLGDGAFYGPKIDVKVKDALGRQWQLATIQLDYQLPQRFELFYDDVDGVRKIPVVIHRAILGSMERFLGILIEHYAGKFPLWLSPVQVKILPIADRHIDYCNKVGDKFKNSGLNVVVNDKAETTNKKIRDAQLENFNYILVVGDKEVENGTVNVRTRNNEVLGEKKVDDFLGQLLADIKSKK
jgi:threonyl-tRNA synthetase